MPDDKQFPAKNTGPHVTDLLGKIGEPTSQNEGMLCHLSLGTIYSGIPAVEIFWFRHHSKKPGSSVFCSSLSSKVISLIYKN